MKAAYPHRHTFAEVLRRYRPAAYTEAQPLRAHQILSKVALSRAAPSKSFGGGDAPAAAADLLTAALPARPGHTPADPSAACVHLMEAHRTHFSHMSHPTFPISHILIRVFVQRSATGA